MKSAAAGGFTDRLRVVQSVPAAKRLSLRWNQRVCLHHSRGFPPSPRLPPYLAPGDTNVFVRPTTNGHKKTVILLIDRGADIAAFGDEAMRQASLNGHADIAKILYARRASGRRAFVPETTPLMAEL